jgi:hypothetical protein
MNGVGLKGEAVNDPAAAEAFLNRSRELFAAADQLYDWRAARVRANVARFGLESITGVPLSDYLAATAPARKLKRDAFVAMLEWLTDDSRSGADR